MSRPAKTYPQVIDGISSIIDSLPILAVFRTCSGTAKPYKASVLCVWRSLRLGRDTMASGLRTTRQIEQGKGRLTGVSRFIYKCRVSRTFSSDRSFPSPMELFLLAFLNNEEFTSLYKLHKRAGINPGAVSHAVRRLASYGAIERKEEGYRRKRDLSVTSEGWAILEEHWADVLKEPTVDSNALTRAIWVIVALGRSRAPFSGAKLLSEAAERVEAPPQDPRPPSLSDEGYWGSLEAYQWIKDVVDRYQARAMTAALRKVAAVLADLPELGDWQDTH